MGGGGGKIHNFVSSLPVFFLHLSKKPSCQSNRDELRKDGSIVGVNGHSSFIIGFEEVILDLLHVLSFEDDELGLALSPWDILQLGVVVHVMVEAHGNQPAFESECDGEVVQNTLLQFILENWIDVIISGTILLVDAIGINEAFSKDVTGLSGAFLSDEFTLYIL